MSTSPPDPAAAPGAADRAHVSRGNLYLSRETCDRYLKGSESVALIERDGRLLVLPLMPGSAGGLLLKVRNARGDRVIHAQEFIRGNGYVEDFVERSVALFWHPDRAALEVSGLPRYKESFQDERQLDID